MSCSNAVMYYLLYEFIYRDIAMYNLRFYLKLLLLLGLASCPSLFASDLESYYHFNDADLEQYYGANKSGFEMVNYLGQTHLVGVYLDNDSNTKAKINILKPAPFDPKKRYNQILKATIYPSSLGLDDGHNYSVSNLAADNQTMLILLDDDTDDKKYLLRATDGAYEFSLIKLDDVQVSWSSNIVKVKNKWLITDVRDEDYNSFLLESSDNGANWNKVKSPEGFWSFGQVLAEVNEHALTVAQKYDNGTKHVLFVSEDSVTWQEKSRLEFADKNKIKVNNEYLDSDSCFIVDMLNFSSNLLLTTFCYVKVDEDYFEDYFHYYSKDSGNTWHSLQRELNGYNVIENLFVKDNNLHLLLLNEDHDSEEAHNSKYLVVPQDYLFNNEEVTPSFEWITEDWVEMYNSSNDVTVLTVKEDDDEHYSVDLFKIYN